MANFDSLTMPNLLPASLLASKHLAAIVEMEKLKTHLEKEAQNARAKTMGNVSDPTGHEAGVS